MATALYRSIFVPLDGSPFAEQALPLAVEIARRAGALLHFALVHHPVPALATALEVPEIETQLDQEARLREKNYLDGIVTRVRSTANVPVSAVILDGAVADALETQIEATGTDLVVSTTHGRGPLSRFWLGSVADQLMRRLHVPLLLVRPASVAAEAPRNIAKVLIALDGSPFAERALTSATALGRPFGASYSLVFVVEPPMPIADPSGLMVLPTSGDTERRIREGATEYLGGVADRLRRDGFQVSCHAVDGATAAGTILEQAGSLKADLIVLASHGAGGFERLVVGSVADKVIRGSTNPVLVVRPSGQPD
jgi:nucleotide-binding universal stress UspA family protein